MPKPGSEGHGKSGHLSDRLRQKGTPEVLYLYTCTQKDLYFSIGENPKASDESRKGGRDRAKGASSLTYVVELRDRQDFWIEGDYLLYIYHTKKY